MLLLLLHTHASTSPRRSLSTCLDVEISITFEVIYVFPPQKTLCGNGTHNDTNSKVAGYSYILRRTGGYLAVQCRAAPSSRSAPVNFNLSALVPNILMCRPDFAPMKDAQIPLLLLLLTGAAFPCSTFITSDMWRHKPSNRVKVRQIWWIFSPILEQQHGNPAELHPWENVIGNSWLSLCLTLLSHILLFALSARVLLLLFASPFFCAAWCFSF